MKIAILSMQKIYNYGSVLQSYSLKKLLEEISGENVEFLNPRRDRYLIANMEIRDKNDYDGKRYINNKLDFIVKKIINKIKMKKFNKEIYKFQNEILNLSDDNYMKTYDLVVEGSDEVFKCLDKVYLNLYGEVENAKKLITYAASCGSANINGLSDENIEIIKEKMKKFSAMSVRDDGTLSYISNFYNGKIYKHLDPVLIGNLDKIQHKKVKDNNYMIVYAYGDRIRNEEEIKAIKKYAKTHNLKTIAIGAPQYWCDKFVVVSPFEMLDYFYYADCVVTDTFHGTIFSVINKTKFVTITRKTNKNKVEDLLRNLQLTSRQLIDIKDIDTILDREIDYDSVQNIIEQERNSTKEYLKYNIVSKE